MMRRVIEMINAIDIVRLYLGIGNVVSLVLPFVLLGMVSRLSWMGYVFWAFVCGVFAFLFWRMRFVEPHAVSIHHVHVPLGLQKKIALISDLHLGVFKDESFLQRIVHKINQISGIDFVVVAGDLTYEPHPHKIHDLFRPFQHIVQEVYAVLGNHDVGFPGPAIREPLAKALSQHNVRLLENHIIAFDDFYLAGLGDFHGQEDDVTILDNCDPQKPKIVIAHNPDTALKYGDRIVDLTLSGHTHAGQVRIPGLLGMAYRHILKLVGPFDHGLHHHVFGKVYVSSGLGEVGMPWRLGSRPRIDIIYV